MTLDQIKVLAKQAGGTAYTNRYYPDDTAVAFGPLALVEFIRLVRESVIEESAIAVLSLKATSSDWCAEKIRSLK